MAFGATQADHRGDLFTTTMHRHGRKVVNAIYDGVPLTRKLIMNNRRRWRGGDGLRVPVRGKLNSKFSFLSGYDTIDISPEETLVSAIYEWRSFRITTSITQDDRADNSGMYAAVNLINDRLTDARESTLHFLEKQWFKLAAGAKEFTTLNEICNNAAAYSTLAGIDGADSENDGYWKPQTFELDRGAELTVKLFKQQQIKVRGATKTRPDICVMDSDSYIDLDSLAYDLVRYNDLRMAELGFETLVLWGTTFMFTDEPTIVTAHNGQLTGADNADRVWYWLTSEFLELSCHRRLWMRQLGPIQKPEQPHADYYTFYSRGQLVATNRRRMGLSRRRVAP